MKRNKFSLSNYKLLTCDMGELVPVGVTEVLPGDTIQHSTSLLLRVSPLMAPVMHPVAVRVHHWFVPYRILWDDFEDFITGGPDGNNQSIFPQVDLGAGITEGSLGDYFGIPIGAPGKVSALPYRAYSMIWNEFYRDQDLQAELEISTESGLDAITNQQMQHVAWEKDYFTSARPWTQKGPDVVLPLGTNAPVKGIGLNANHAFQAGAETWRETGGSTWTQPSKRVTSADAANIFAIKEDPDRVGFPGIFADLTEAAAANVNDLRLAMALQRYQEARARWGSRYTEYLRYLGVRSSDARLQRPEYLGGGKQIIQFSEVLQTANTTDGDDTEGVGNLRGHGISAMRSNRYRRFFEEHGVVISLLSVRPKTMYSQGIHRSWMRRTKEDFFQRELQHIGQQEIYNAEVYAAAAEPTGVFGYQDRYDEYRRAESTISGEFRSLLDFWHYGRVFANEPVLNGDFIKSVPTKRTNAVQTNDVLWIMANHSIQARRMIAKSGSSFIK